MLPEQAAKQIVGEEIRLLMELQQMAANPRIFEFMCRIVDTARNGSLNGSGARDVVSQLPSTTIPNGLTESVLKCCEEIEAGITIAGVVDKLTQRGFTFVSKDPKVAVADVIRRYTDKKLKVTRQGLGNQPNVYAWIGEQQNAA